VSTPSGGRRTLDGMSAEPNVPIASRYASANASLLDVIEGITPEGWRAPSPCEGWTALDVLTHMFDSQRSFLVDRGLDLGTTPDLTSDPVAGWTQHSTAVQSLLDDPAVVATEYDGWFGRTTIGEPVERFYLFDMYVHRWDIATGAPMRILEVPLVLMDTTLSEERYLGLSPEDAWDEVERVLDHLHDVGGCASILWHNDRFDGVYGRGWDKLYDRLLDGIAARGGHADTAGALAAHWRDERCAS